MGPIEHYEKLIEGKRKLLHRGKKRIEQNIKDKQIIEIERHKRLFTKKNGRDRRVKNQSD